MDVVSKFGELWTSFGEAGEVRTGQGVQTDTTEHSTEEIVSKRLWCGDYRIQSGAPTSRASLSGYRNRMIWATILRSVCGCVYAAICAGLDPRLYSRLPV